MIRRTARPPSTSVAAFSARCGLVLILAFAAAPRFLIAQISSEAGGSAVIGGQLAWNESPSWTRDLVIYQIAPKAFTSPNGPESGNFNSLRARLPYLQDLGINAIWLSGHSLSDPKHFFNIWSQYACIEPDQIDPSLGTEDQFKDLIDESHRRGIRVFLDVITHGVMKNSRLVSDHQDWFLGEDWVGMREYDWQGGHLDLDNWWVSMWTNYVVKYGVDGFRLDLGTTRPDLWAKIRQKAAAAGHPIIIFEEGTRTVPGVTDFAQDDNIVSDGKSYNGLLLQDVPRFYRTKFGREGAYKVEVLYSEGGKETGEVGHDGVLKVHLDGLAGDRASSYADSLNRVPGLQLSVDGIETSKPMERISVQSSTAGLNWGSEATKLSWSAYIATDSSTGAPSAYPVPQVATLALSGSAPGIQIHIQTLTPGNSVQLSCHDNGQVGLPIGKNPYSAKGSRSAFGYSFLFTPMIPHFMSGEEFDASFKPLPNLASDFYAGKDVGKGTWLYGAMLDWNEITQRSHRDMLEDVKHMLAIRSQEASVLRPQLRGDVEPNLAAVPYNSDITVPVPYVRWNRDAMLIILGNRNTESDAHITLDIPLVALNRNTTGRYKLTDLWNNGHATIYSGEELHRFGYTVRRDRSPHGGIGVIKVERAD